MEKIIDYVNETPYNTNIGILKDKLRKYSNELMNNAVKSVNGMPPDEQGNVDVVADWNDMVNRPFYEEEVSAEIFNGFPMATDSGYQIEISEPLNVSTNYRVTIDSHVQVSKPYSGPPSYALTFFGEGVIQIEFNEGDTVSSLVQGLTETNYVKIERIDDQILVPLPEKFMPSHTHTWESLEGKPFGEEVEGVLIDVTEYDALAEAEKNDRVANTVYVDSETTLEFLSQPFVVFKKSNIVSVGDTITYSINGTEYTNTVKSMEYTFRYEDDNGNLIVDDTGTIIGCGNACYADEGITTEYSTGDHLLQFVGDDHIILYVGEDDVEEMFNPLTFSLTGKHITTVPSIFLPDEVVTEEELANAINEVKEEMPEGGEVSWNDIKDKPFYTEPNFVDIPNIGTYTGTNDSTAQSVFSFYKESLSNGKWYQVVLNEKKYKCKAYTDADYTEFLGNISLYPDTVSYKEGDDASLFAEYSTYPFLVVVPSGQGTYPMGDVYFDSSITDFTITMLVEDGTTSEYLDPAFLPKTTPISDVTATPTAEQFNALLAALRAAGYMAE